MRSSLRIVALAHCDSSREPSRAHVDCIRTQALPALTHSLLFFYSVPFRPFPVQGLSLLATYPRRSRALLIGGSACCMGEGTLWGLLYSHHLPTSLSGCNTGRSAAHLCSRLNRLWISIALPLSCMCRASYRFCMTLVVDRRHCVRPAACVLSLLTEPLLSS